MRDVPSRLVLELSWPDPQTCTVRVLDNSTPPVLLYAVTVAEELGEDAQRHALEDVGHAINRLFREHL